MTNASARIKSFLWTSLVNQYYINRNANKQTNNKQTSQLREQMVSRKFKKRQKKTLASHDTWRFGLLEVNLSDLSEKDSGRGFDCGGSASWPAQLCHWSVCLDELCGTSSLQTRCARPRRTVPHNASARHLRDKLANLKLQPTFRTNWCYFDASSEQNMLEFSGIIQSIKGHIIQMCFYQYKGV